MKNQNRIEKNRVEDIRNRISIISKIVGVFLLVLIIGGMLVNKNDERYKGVDSIKESEVKLSEELISNEDGSVLEEKVNKLVDAKDNDKNVKNKRNSVEGKKSYIGKDSAKNIAYKDARVSVNKVYNLEIDLDYDDGKQVYEISFDCGNMEYDYEIDAQSGKILKKEKEM